MVTKPPALKHTLLLSRLECCWAFLCSRAREVLDLFQVLFYLSFFFSSFFSRFSFSPMNREVTLRFVCCFPVFLGIS